MADLKVRQLDDAVADSLKARAGRKGVSLEEEVRTTRNATLVADTVNADSGELSRGVEVSEIPSA